jgi:energy-converting hydrogenase Eha subunit G
MPELIAITAAVVIIVRILTFRRGRSRYRPGVAIAAWCVLAVCTWLAVRLITTGEPDAWWLALVLAGIAALLLRAGGNLAHIFSHRPRRRH